MQPRRVDGYPLAVTVATGAPVMGIEHEFRVLDGDRQIDFAPLLHTLRIEGLRLDPTDPNAYRTPWGGLVTSDGREAEVAIAPVTLGAGCTSEIDWRTRVAYRALASALPSPLRLDGYSTHLNIEVDDDAVVAAGRLFVSRFAPAMMLMLDRPTSPGLLVRPRGGRLEIGGEYAEGKQLRAAATFAAAGTLACSAAVSSRAARRRLPRAVRSRVRPSNVRAGWYVDRRAFGSDLYRDGRNTRLHFGAVRTWTAQDHLEEAWAHARPFVVPLLNRTELVRVDRVVEGTDSLPLEGGSANSGDPLGPFADNPFGQVVRPRTRNGYRIEPMSIAWDAVAFQLRGARDAIACVPRAALGCFLADLDAGRLDDRIRRFLAAPPRGLVLQSSEQATSPGLFDEIASPGAIVPPERVPGRGRFGNGKGGTPADSRRDKNRRKPQPKRALVAAVVLVAVAVLAGGVAVAARGGAKRHDAGAAGGLGSATAGGASGGGNGFAGTYRVTFTPTARTLGGPSIAAFAPVIGAADPQQILVIRCTDAGCTTEFDASSPARSDLRQFGSLALGVGNEIFPPLTGTADHFGGTHLIDKPTRPECSRTAAVIVTDALDLVRAADGAVAGFHGTIDLKHRDTIRQDNPLPQGPCISYNATWAMTGTKL